MFFVVGEKGAADMLETSSAIDPCAILEVLYTPIFGVHLSTKSENCYVVQTALMRYETTPHCLGRSQVRASSEVRSEIRANEPAKTKKGGSQIKRPISVTETVTFPITYSIGLISIVIGPERFHRY
jgi:hypothetical protein